MCLLLLHRIYASSRLEAGTEYSLRSLLALLHNRVVVRSVTDTSLFPPLKMFFSMCAVVSILHVKGALDIKSGRTALLARSSFDRLMLLNLPAKCLIIHARPPVGNMHKLYVDATTMKCDEHGNFLVYYRPI